VVPTLLYYGLKILHPKIFLPATLLICSVCSLATGTSWGTTGTLGIALIRIGKKKRVDFALGGCIVTIFYKIKILARL
jgi:NhaC family Na+:H+ antiporter